MSPRDMRRETELEARLDAVLEDLRHECRLDMRASLDDSTDAGPAEDRDGMDLADLAAAARLVRAAGKSGEPQPKPGFVDKIQCVVEAARVGGAEGLVDKVTDRKTEKTSDRTGVESDCGSLAKLRVRNRMARHRLVWGSVAAALILCVGISYVTGFWSRDIARAMANAVSKVTSYHGVLEKTYTTLSGESQVVSTVEVWTSGEKYATLAQDGTLTVNDGQRKWQVRPDEQLVAVLPSVPDPHRSGLDLQDEADRALQYPHEPIGEDVVAGSKAVCLEIRPPGGLPYHLWVDTDTWLPVQLCTAMQNGIQTTYTYVSLETDGGVDEEIFTYKVPQGYRVEEADAGQVVMTPAEAQGIAGFAPLLPTEAPQRILAFGSGRIVLDYGSTVVTEINATKEFEPATYGAIGTAAGGPLEILEDHLRWCQGELEITVQGPRRLVLARQMVDDLTIPDSQLGIQFAPEVAVPVDMEIAGNDQQQVDGGHSPWQLDPLQVALTFVNLKVTPKGIVGEPEIGYGSFTLDFSDGVKAIVGVTEGPVSRVYLERLIRQDDTGIWSVVGYDPR
jgi:outer membrane lipoprotein-sorting protein